VILIIIETNSLLVLEHTPTN